MAVPFRRTSKTSKRMRRTHFKLSVSGLVKCPNCGATIKSHNVCPKCGHYDGKDVMAKKDKSVVDVKPAPKAAKKPAAKKAPAKKPAEKSE
ncbi:MAG: 50S ribosomal protein L32 [Bacilli bacterium]|nr:50S ribosomal protein L32 [Bacilli bacterium]